MRSKKSYVVLLVAMGLVASFGSAMASPSEARIQAHVNQHNLRTRVVERTVGGRSIRRIFVPVLENTAADFVNATVGENHGTMALHVRPASNHPVGWNHYVRLGVDPNTTYASAYDASLGPKATEQRGRDAMKWITGSRWLLLDVGTEAVRGAVSFLDQFHKSNSYTSDKNAYAADRGDRAGDLSADCMWWLTNLELEPAAHPGKNFLPAFGVKRTRGPQEIPSILMHAAKNERHTVVGVAVKTLEEFDGLTEAQLFGNEPTNGGAAGAVRPRAAQPQERPAQDRPAEEPAAQPAPENEAPAGGNDAPAADQPAQ